MRSALSSIGKNLILTALVVVSVINFFSHFLNWRDLVVIQIFFGLAYVFLSCYEFLNTQYKAMLPVQRYSYFTNSYVMFKALKIFIFIGFSILLFLSGNRMKYLYPLCIIVALTETLVLFLKYKKGLCFISIYANYLLFAQDKINKVFASHIEVVEFRHDILYFVKKDNKSYQVKLVHIDEREEFLSAIKTWLSRNRIRIGEESAEKLNSMEVS
jgi:hypothetical protein